MDKKIGRKTDRWIDSENRVHTLVLALVRADSLAARLYLLQGGIPRRNDQYRQCFGRSADLARAPSVVLPGSRLSSALVN